MGVTSVSAANRDNGEQTTVPPHEHGTEKSQNISRIFPFCRCNSKIKTPEIDRTNNFFK